MSSTVLRATDLGKVYRLYDRPWDRFLEIIIGGHRHRPLSALAGVSFELSRGQSLGIVGENGAGKSTLLKILSGVTRASHGELEVKGKVASLLELGMGFHPEFTGRQNIRLNAAMMGLDERQVQQKTPEIIEFSELGDFIDRPVKTYSTGMAMRLGFAIAVQVEPEILIIDEALSVGDGYFQKKCMGRLMEFLRSGRTLLFCSHAMYYVSSFCHQALWLRHGRAEQFGPVDEVVRAYENFLASKSEAAAPTRPPAEERQGPAKIRKARFPGHEEGQPPHFRSRQPWALEIEWTTDDASMPTHLGIGINNASDVEVCAFATHHDGLPPFVGSRHYRARLLIPDLPLLKGEFNLYVFLVDENGLHVYDQIILPSAFAIANDGYHFGMVHVPHRWEAE